MNTSYSSLLKDLKNHLDCCRSINDLYNIKSKYLGKKGYLSTQFSSMGSLNNNERKALGQELNEIKEKIESLIKDKEKELALKRAKPSTIDVGLPGRNINLGTRHPISVTIREITNILSQFGFSKVVGREVETEFYNFEALNIPKSHPARDMHDTFYINAKNLLRTHTSSVQIHSMERLNAPLKIMTPGKVYRCDSDPTHSPMFHQIEGLYVDKDVNFSHLKGLLEKFIKANR